MGACETTPTTTRDPGNQPSDLRTRQPAGTPQAVPPQPGDQVTGSIQHCLLTTKAPMGAVLRGTAGCAGPVRSSSRGEFHPPALAEPCLTVSRYTALLT